MTDIYHAHKEPPAKNIISCITHTWFLTIPTREFIQLITPAVCMHRQRNGCSLNFYIREEVIKTIRDRTEPLHLDSSHHIEGCSKITRLVRRKAEKRNGNSRRVEERSSRRVEERSLADTNREYFYVYLAIRTLHATERDDIFTN